MRQTYKDTALQEMANQIFDMMGLSEEQREKARAIVDAKEGEEHDPQVYMVASREVLDKTEGDN